MKIKEVTIKTFEAFDGTPFSDKDECVKYENEIFSMIILFVLIRILMNVLLKILIM